MRQVMIRINPLTAEWAFSALIDFTLCNARRFYSSMGNPLDGKGLKGPSKSISLLWKHRILAFPSNVPYWNNK